MTEITLWKIRKWGFIHVVSEGVSIGYELVEDGIYHYEVANDDGFIFFVNPYTPSIPKDVQKRIKSTMRRSVGASAQN